MMNRIGQNGASGTYNEPQIKSDHNLTQQEAFEKEASDRNFNVNSQQMYFLDGPKTADGPSKTNMPRTMGLH